MTIELDDARRAALERLARGEGGGPGLDLKAKVILLPADGLSPSETARRTGAPNSAVVCWRKRFLARGIGYLASSLRRRRRPGGGWPPPEPQRGGFVLTGGDRFELERRVREGDASAMAERARIILLGAGDLDLEETARRVGVEPGVALFWWRRSLGRGLEGLRGAPPGGPELGAAAAALPGEPPPGRTGPWTAPAMARALGLERSAARSVMVELVAPPEGRPDDAGAEPGPLARRAAALVAAAPPAPLRRWTVEAVARALGVSCREARRGLVEVGRWPLPGGGRPPDGGGGG